VIYSSYDFEESEKEKEAAETVESEGREEEEEDEEQSSGQEKSSGASGVGGEEKLGCHEEKEEGGKLTFTQYNLIMQQLIAHDRNSDWPGRNLAIRPGMEK